MLPDCTVILIQQGPLATVLDVGYGQLKRTRVACCLCNNHFFFSCYSHQSISDLFLGGVHCTLRCVLLDEPTCRATCMRIEPV